MTLAQTVLSVLAGLGLALGFAAQMARWLRVLQREHYDPSSMRRFLARWSTPPVAPATAPQAVRDRRPVTLSHVLFVVLVVSVVLRADVLVVLSAIAYGLVCPWGLSVRGRTSPLVWTRRLRTIAVLATVVALVITAAGAWSTQPWLAPVAMVWAVPLLLDVTTRILHPLEERHAREYVDRARARVAAVAPRVVAITGSYGKTSTKNHLLDLLRDDGAVVASPRSFNNRAGLSRAINENLADGTRVFIAEMGTYGPGEIRALCDWCPPEVAVVSAIGPVHLERMGSLDVIDAAKFEITERASIVVVNVDDSRLARWVPRLLAQGRRVRTAGSRTPDAAVRVVEETGRWRVLVDGDVVADVDAVAGLQATNVACAIAAALELGVDPRTLAPRLSCLQPVSNRSQVVTAPSGVLVIDDTFNANPASARAALALLSSLAVSGRRVVVTPGMIELGSLQYGENLVLAQQVLAHGAELVVVGRTNAVPLSLGAERGAMRVDTRDEAVAWVRSHLGPGDAVLYLNDLPDHYP